MCFLSFPIGTDFHSFGLGQVFPFLGFSHISVWSFPVSRYMVSTTPGLPPQLLPLHVLQLPAQAVLSPRLMKSQEAWVLIGLKTVTSCPPNISLQVPPFWSLPCSGCPPGGWLPPPLQPPQDLLHLGIRPLPGNPLSESPKQ